MELAFDGMPHQFHWMQLLPAALRKTLLPKLLSG